MTQEKADGLMNNWFRLRFIVKSSSCTHFCSPDGKNSTNGYHVTSGHCRWCMSFRWLARPDNTPKTRSFKLELDRRESKAAGQLKKVIILNWLLHKNLHRIFTKWINRKKVPFLSNSLRIKLAVFWTWLYVRWKCSQILIHVVLIKTISFPFQMWDSMCRKLSYAESTM